MDLIETLKENYAPGEPIFTANVEFPGRSRSWVSKELTRLCKLKELCKFDKGVYYISGRQFDLDKYVYERYIWPRGKSCCIGYHTGDTFLYENGLITTAPKYIEICTKNESTRLRKKELGGKLHLRLRKPHNGIIINGDNIPTLQLLDVLSMKNATFFSEERLAILRGFIRDNCIGPKEVLTNLKFYKDHTAKALLLSGLTEFNFRV